MIFRLSRFWKSGDDIDFGNGHFTFGKGEALTFMVFEKAHCLSRCWKNGGDKDFGYGQFTFEKGEHRLFNIFEKAQRLSRFWIMGVTMILEMDNLHLKKGGSNFYSI